MDAQIDEFAVSEAVDSPRCDDISLDVAYILVSKSRINSVNRIPSEAALKISRSTGL